MPFGLTSFRLYLIIATECAEKCKNARQNGQGLPPVCRHPATISAAGGNRWGVVYNRQTRRRRDCDVYSPPRLNVPQTLSSKTFMPCKATALRGFSYAHRGVVLKREGDGFCGMGG